MTKIIGSKNLAHQVARQGGKMQFKILTCCNRGYCKL